MPCPGWQWLHVSLRINPSPSWDLQCPFCLPTDNLLAAMPSSPALVTCAPVTRAFSLTLRCIKFLPICGPLMLLPLGSLFPKTFTSCSPFKPALQCHLFRALGCPLPLPLHLLSTTLPTFIFSRAVISA